MDLEPLLCGDCGMDTGKIDSVEMYGLKNELWQQVNLNKPVDFLCIGCLEKRLGREVDANDFSDVLLNEHPAYQRSERLKDRLARNRTTHAMRLIQKIAPAQIHDPLDLKAGDIVATPHDEYQVRIYCVESVIAKPLPPNLLPPVPRARFLEPHIGLSTAYGDVLRYHLYVPMPGESYACSWFAESQKQAFVDWGVGEITDCFFSLYRVADPDTLKLGGLISQVRIPNVNFLCQTNLSEGPEKLYNFVESIKGDLEEFRSLYARMKTRERLPEKDAKIQRGSPQDSQATV